MAAMATAIVTSAAVVTAGVLLSVMVVVVAFCIGVVGKCSGDTSNNSIVRVSANTTEQLDACLGKSHLGTAANASADENINAEIGKQACQCAVTASVGVNDFCLYNNAILDIIHLELFGMTEMLEDFSVFVSYCNFHLIISFGFNCFIDFLNWTAKSTAVKVTAMISATGSAIYTPIVLSDIRLGIR